MTDQTIAEKPTSQQVLDLALPDNDSGESTVRGYLIALLTGVFLDSDFSSKRPFGDSGWRSSDLYIPLVLAGMVAGAFDEDGDLMDLDHEAASALIADAIQSLGAS